MTDEEQKAADKTFEEAARERAAKRAKQAGLDGPPGPFGRLFQGEATATFDAEVIRPGDREPTED